MSDDGDEWFQQKIRARSFEDNVFMTRQDYPSL
jgi:hypothetical protein